MEVGIWSCFCLFVSIVEHIVQLYGFIWFSLKSSVHLIIYIYPSAD